MCPLKVFGIRKPVYRILQIKFEHKGLLGAPGRFFVPVSFPKGPSGRFESSGEGVGIRPFSHVHACVSREDISRVKKRRGCRYSEIPVGLVQGHPRTLGDVTPSAFGS